MSQIFIGLDIGGTKIGVNGVTEARKPLAPQWVEVEARSNIGPEATIEQIVVGLRDFLDKTGLKLDSLAAVGVDSPGPGDLDGNIQRSANMHPAWEGFPLRRRAQEAISKLAGREIRVSYENDCNAAALWESFVGNPQGTEVMALLAPGTGLGGGIVINGRLLRGSRGMGAELGHIEIVHPNFIPQAEPLCGCGQKYCTEAYASLAAMGRFLPVVLQQPKYKNHPLQQIQGSEQEIWRKRAFAVRGLAAKGDELALAIFDWQSEALGKLCRQLADTIDPDRIVIGGGFIEGGEQLTSRIMGKIRETFKGVAFAKHAAEVRIETAAAADQAGCLGAALSAWESVNRR